MVLGVSSREPDLSLVTNTETLNGAVLTHSLFASITLKASTPPVVRVNQPLSATRHAIANLDVNTPRIRFTPRVHTLSPTTLQKSKLKS